LTDLAVLSLDDTQVSDEGLKHMNGLSNLDHLFLINTRVTEEGVKELQKALSDCKIYH